MWRQLKCIRAEETCLPLPSKISSPLSSKMKANKSLQWLGRRSRILSPCQPLCVRRSLGPPLGLQNPQLRRV